MVFRNAASIVARKFGQRLIQNSPRFIGNYHYRLRLASINQSCSVICNDHHNKFRTTTIRRPFSSSSSDQLEKDFQTALANFHKVSFNLDEEKKTKLYALARQGFLGPCSENKSSIYGAIDKAQWQAWKSLGDMTAEDAKKEYIKMVNELLTDEHGKEPHLIFEKRDHTYWIKLNRPKQYNAILPDMYEGVVDALKRAADDKDIKFTIFTGNGPFYSSGNDLTNFTKAIEVCDGDMQKALQQSRDGCQRFVSAFIDFPKPLIAVVNGPAFGIMFTVLGLFDCIVANEKAYFICPFSSLGQSPEGCSTYTFPRMFGNSLASELLYFNYKMPVEEAHRLGFISRIINSDKMDSHVNEWLYGKNGLVNTCYPNSMFNAKNLVRNEDKRLKLHQINKDECDVLMQSWTSEECAQALEKFYSRKSSS